MDYVVQKILVTHAFDFNSIQDERIKVIFYLW